MRLGLAAWSVAAVFGSYALLNTIDGQPAEPPEGLAPGEHAAASAPARPSAESAPETRSYELIRYQSPDGSLGLVDDPRRVPAGAKILSRERKALVVAEPEPASPEPGYSAELEEEERMLRMIEERQASTRRLAAIQRRIMDTVFGGWLGGSGKLGEVQQDLDAMQREAERMNDCADGDCPERVESVPASDGQLRSAVPRRSGR